MQWAIVCVWPLALAHRWPPKMAHLQSVAECFASEAKQELQRESTGAVVASGGGKVENLVFGFPLFQGREAEAV